jgi:hypothetical protein
MDFTKLTATLEELGYKVTCFDTAAQAADYLNGQIDGRTVGIGGSVTLRDMGIYDRLSTHNQVNWHWFPEGKTVDEARMAAFTSDVYLSSVNALAATGELINIDGACNRVAGTLYGHQKVYFVLGANKIAPDYDSALFRARNVAAPLNAQRLARKTPCAAKGDKCYNCKSPERICRGLTVLWEAPSGCAYEIILINESLGF